MHIALVHGYFLGDSGSGIYVREFARELVRQGHEVTLVCQEPHPESHDFIDCAFELDEDNQDPREVFCREGRYAGSCRAVRPNLAGRILTYAVNAFPGFESTTFQEAPDAWIDEYITKNVKALITVFERWPPELVQANHLIMQPYVTHQALVATTIEGLAPSVVTAHGSELNFTIRKDPRMEHYAVEALHDASIVVAPSEPSTVEVLDFAQSHGVNVVGKLYQVLPGVNVSLFFPTADRTSALCDISNSINPHRDDILFFVGRLLWTKGLHYAVAAMPLALQSRPNLHLIIAGEGPIREPIERMIGALDAGDLGEVRRITREEPELRGVPDFGPVLPQISREEAPAYIKAASGLKRRIHFLGHMAHEKLAGIYAASDLSLAPSVFPEAFGLVSIEALSSGALPIATYQSGLTAPLDSISAFLKDPFLKRLKPGVSLSRGIAESITGLLESYPTKDMAFRESLHLMISKRFSWTTVVHRYLSLIKTSREQLKQ